jgi:hypothetical protein
MPQFKPNNLLTTKDDCKFIPNTYGSDLSRGSSVEERGTHNPEVVGATPSPASIPSNVILGYN